MPVTPEIIYSLLLELEQGDPQDFANLSLSEDDARRLVCNSVCQLTRNLAADGMGAESREALALAICARLVLENLVLHVERLQREGVARVDAAALLRTLAARR